MLINGQPSSPITSVVNITTVNLVHKFLSREDYTDAVAELNDTSVLTDLVDLMLYLLRHGDLSNSMQADGRARRLMLNIIAKTRVMPMPLFVTGVRVKTDRDYVSGSFGLVFKGELQGKVVALKVLHELEGHENIVSYRSHNVICKIYSNRTFFERH